MPSILGLGYRDFSPYYSNSSIGLDDWANIGSESTLPYYSKSALFVKYIYTIYGLDFIKDIFLDASNQGIESIKANLNDEQFNDLYINWLENEITS